jgi:hypothetical protein
MAAAAPAVLARNPLPQDDELQSLLAISDRIRNPAHAFGVDIAVTEYRNRRVVEEGRIVVLARPDASVGQYDSLVHIVEPRRDRGKLMLKTAEGNEVWFYDPAVKSGLRISLQQRLLGQAANGDVASINLAHEYRARAEAVEAIADGDRNERTCLRLRLAGTGRTVVYPAITYWIEQGSSRPVKAQFHADSGRLLKTAYYRRFEEHLGQSRPTEVVIIDGVDPALVTLLRYSGFRPSQAPASWFSREGLPLVQAQAL